MLSPSSNSGRFECIERLIERVYHTLQSMVGRLGAL